MKSSNQGSCLCDCGCHKEGSRMLHVAPCCDKCKICGQHIKFFCMNDHLKYCRPNSGKSGQNYVKEQIGITSTIQGEEDAIIILEKNADELL